MASDSSRSRATMQTLSNGAEISSNAWLSYYRFNLYSNFTFFLNDPENGDQINQRENRLLGGANTEYTQTFNVKSSEWKLKAGAGFRYDQINDLALYHTVKRERIGTFALGNVGESSMFGYAGLNIEWGKWMINPAVRLDYFKFDYVDRTLPDSALERGRPLYRPAKRYHAGAAVGDPGNPGVQQRTP